jgi:S1-C subfamily serine protease
VLATISLLATSWFLGITFRDTQFTTVGSEIQDSSIIRTLDAIAPALPPQLAKVGQVLNGATFPNPFAGLAPQLAPIAVPPALNTPGVRQAAAVTSKVVSESSTCGAEAGSAWPIGNDYMATNAHVVAGAGRVRVIPPGGRTYAATVVLFDPLVDVAVLRVPGVKLAPLAMAREAPPRGLLGAAIGYPGGDVEASSPAAVMGTEIADSYDIYNTTRVTRQIEVLAASIIPGDSGGPVVDADGTVIGMTFATSTTTPNAEGYALTLPEIHDDLVAGGQNTRSVSTQGCTGN